MHDSYSILASYSILSCVVPDEISCNLHLKNCNDIVKN